MAIDAFAISNIGSLVMASVTGLIALRFWKTIQEEDVYTIEMLYKSFAYFGLFQLVLGSQFFYSGLGSVETTGITIFAHMFLYLCLAYFSRIATHIYYPEYKEYVFGSLLVAGALAMHLMISTWSQIVPVIAIPTLAVWIGLGTIVFAKMARDSEGLQKKKLILMALGFFLLAISGPLHGLAQGMQYILVEAMTVLSVLVIFTGVYYGELLNKRA